MNRETERRTPPATSPVHDRSLAVSLNLNNILTALVIMVLAGMYHGNQKMNESLNNIASTQTMVVYRVQILENKHGIPVPAPFTPGQGLTPQSFSHMAKMEDSYFVRLRPDYRLATPDKHTYNSL